MKKLFRCFALVGSLIPLFEAPAVSAESVVFNIVPQESQVTLSGSVSGYAIQQQASGSLVTSYSGTIKAEVTGDSIQFTGGSVLDSAVNGTWQPASGGGAGSAPADYGAQVSTPLGTARGALRNIVLDLQSDPIAISNSSFPATNLVFAFPAESTAVFDFNAGFLGSGSHPFAGKSTNETATVATLANSATQQTLTINIDTVFQFNGLQENDSRAHLTGKVVATRALPELETKFTSISIQNGTIRLEAEGAGSYRLESSSDLVHWSPVNPTVTTEGEKTVYSAPTNGGIEFFRLVKV
jgi:hypothetical protein